jgi:hypothetical protein
MVTRVTGAPAIQEPRAGIGGGPDLRSTQVAVQNIRERFRLLELALNNLVVPEEAASSSSTSSGNAGGPPGAIQYTDAGGGFAGSMSLTWSATNQELTIIGDTYFNGNLYQNGSLLTFVTGIYADGVDHVGLVNLVAGSGITIDALTGNVIQISSAASAGVNSVNSLQGNITLQAGSGVSIVTLTGNVIEVSASASAGVSSLNLLTGPVTIQGGSNVTVTLLTGGVIEIAASGSGGGGISSVSAGSGISVTPLTGNAVQVAANLVAGANITLTPLTGNAIEISSSASGGVSSLNAMVGAVTLQAGSNVTITPLTGNVIEISASGGGGGGVTSLNTLTGPVTIQGDGTVGVTLLSGNVIELSAASSSGVTSLNYLTGPVTIRGEGGITVGFGTGNVIELRGTIFTTGTTPPGNPLPGDRWVQNETGIMFTYYDDGDTSQWVDFSSQSGGDVIYPLGIDQGGTGTNTASGAINALLPSQGGNSGKFLTTNGSVASWGTVSGIPTSGTWTPALAGSIAGTFSGVTSWGTWTRIGDTVFIQGNAEWTGNSGFSGGIQVSGLPYTVGSEETPLALRTVGAVTATDAWVAAQFTTGDDAFIISQHSTAGGTSALASVQTTGNIQFSGSYQV